MHPKTQTSAAFTHCTPSILLTPLLHWITFLSSANWSHMSGIPYTEGFYFLLHKDPYCNSTPSFLGEWKKSGVVHQSPTSFPWEIESSWNLPGDWGEPWAMVVTQGIQVQISQVLWRINTLPVTGVRKRILCVVSGLTLRTLFGRDLFILSLATFGLCKMCSCCNSWMASPSNPAPSMISQVSGITCGINDCWFTSCVILLSPRLCKLLASRMAGGFYSSDVGLHSNHSRYLFKLPLLKLLCLLQLWWMAVSGARI